MDVHSLFGRLSRSECNGMTLIEILVAMAVLAVGMMGICALLPLSIRNTSTSVHQSVGASVAKIVAESLQRSSLDLSGLHSLPENPDIAGVVLDGDAGSLQEGIARYSANNSPISGSRGFQIPRDVNNVQEITRGEAIVSLAGGGETHYSWSATLVPDIPPGQSVEAGETNIDYTVQVAVWHEYEILDEKFNDGPQWKIEGDRQTVEVDFGTRREADAFWSDIGAGDYIRDEQHGWWFRIGEVREKESVIVLKEPVPDEVARAHSTNHGRADAASRFHLISLYSFSIR
jgi:prepilin-type N-terminal cleavage/methylation domain-containing protein